MKKCRWCLEWKNDDDFRLMNRKIEVMDGEVFRREIKEYLETLCKECYGRGKRYKRGTQTRSDILMETLIMLRRVRDNLNTSKPAGKIKKQNTMIGSCDIGR